MKIKDGEILIYPTDTVYGMGAKVNDLEAQKRLAMVKGRSQDMRFAVLCADVNQIKEIAIVDEYALKVIENFMPGELTIILPSLNNLNNLAVKENVGVRIPNNLIALDLLKENGPLATTSVNITHEPPINDPEIIKEKFSDKVDYIIEEKDYKPSEIASTVIEIYYNQVKIIRPGAISEEDIINVMKR